MLFSLCLDTQRPWQDVRSIAAAADAAGWHSIYVPDHFMPHDARNRPRRGPLLEAWTCLAAVATLTQHVRLGTLVLGNTYRHPAVVATLQPALPILIGGGGERRRLAIAARYGDAWHTWATSSEFRHKSQALDRHCEAAGRSPTDIRRVCGATVRIASACRESVGWPDDDGTVNGSAEAVAETIDRYRQAGVEEFIVRDDARTPVVEANDSLLQFQQEVVQLLL